jgi:hypothetical protein
MTPTTIGAIGVAVLLVAFVLNLLKQLQEDSSLYLIMNFVGAGAAAWYAVATRATPFIVLECVWAIFALIKLLTATRKGSSV